VSRLLLRTQRALLPEGTIQPASVLVEDGRIASAGVGITAYGTETVDLGDLLLAPGLIDLHVHGGGGYSLTGGPEPVRGYARWVVRHGVTTLMATIVGSTIEDGLAIAEATAPFVGPTEGGASVLGLNFEGPFVSPERPGALPGSWLERPSMEAFFRIAEAAAGTLRMMTVAPELDGAPELIAAAAREGVVASVGHTYATFAEARAGFEAGATHVTHAFNAMRPFHHRDPGPLGAALEAGASVEAIADGFHLHEATVALLTRAFGTERTCLVTDAVTPAGLERGVFRIGGMEATLKDGKVTLPDGTIAGSGVTMDEVVRNAARTAGVEAALRMASETPARVARLEGKGRIAEGCDADLVALDEELRVARTWAGGRLVYSRPD
jgi:N-acetylglucosamine-6-phosphate deacetylase